MTPNTEKLVEKVLEDCKRFADKNSVPAMSADIEYALSRIKRDQANGR